MTVKTFRNIFFATILGFSFSAQADTALEEWFQSNDHFRETVVTNQRFSMANTPKNCRDNIQQVLCRAEKAPPGVDDLDRPCLPGGKQYAHFFETLYDHYPPALQKMFCSLKVIFIEEQFDGTAYAGLIRNEKDEVIGAQMGIRRSVLDENLDLNKWATWKEQLSFGGVLDSYTLSPHLPNIETRASLSGANLFLYFVITHEFGHLFDFANNINKTERCEKDPVDKEDHCLMSRGSWGAISWVTDRVPKAAWDFFKRNRLCFYWCGKNPLSQGDITPVYADLHKSNFVSTYGTRQPWDDLADTLGYYMMEKNLGASYVIDTRQGHRYDIMEKLRSPLMKEKINYLDRFLNRKDIVYP